MMVRLLILPLMSVLVVVALVACSESPAPSPKPPVAPTVAPTSTPVPTPIPTPSPTPVVPFDQSLSSADLANFQALPLEIQEALVDESLESGNGSALVYLRDMPDDPAPLSAILEPETLSLLNSIDDPYRRELLLEGYPNSTVRYWKKHWLAGDLTDLEYRYGDFASMIHEVHRTLSEDGHLLPPLEETLSPAALTRFESLDPLLQDSFRIVWETWRTKTPSDSADRLEQDLLNVPAKLPSIQELGLSDAAVRVLEQEPAMRDYALGTVAAVLVDNQEWDDERAARLERTIAAYDAPGGREALARGLRPGVSDAWLAVIACQPTGWGPIPPDNVIPKPFRGVHPARFIYYWPSPEESLSDAALAKLNLLDETMREALEFWWYGTGPLPFKARIMRCLIAQWDRGIADTPFTSMPGPEVFLPEDKRDFYNELSDYEKEATERNLARAILKGEVLFKRSRFGQTEKVSTIDSTQEEFLEGLRFEAVEWLCGFHPPACR